jgi:para-nitrobenzyl esterase
MVSPLSKKLIAGAIGESGSLLGALSPIPLKDGEQTGVQFAKSIGANNLRDLRKMNADSLVKAASKFGPFRFSMTIDGYFIPKDPLAIFQAGEQAHVPLLVGWNSEESGYRGVMGNENLTRENFEKTVLRLYGEKSADVLKAYPVTADSDVEQAATNLASDRFIGLSAWRWAELQAKTGNKPVFRYYYLHPRPPVVEEKNKARAKGAVHSAEIEYVMGNLSSNKVFAWTEEDYKVSKIMQEYFANFIKTGDQNGAGLVKWPSTTSAKPIPVMNIGIDTRIVPDKYAQRYSIMEEAMKK